MNGRTKSTIILPLFVAGVTLFIGLNVPALYDAAGAQQSTARSDFAPLWQLAGVAVIAAVLLLIGFRFRDAIRGTRAVTGNTTGVRETSSDVEVRATGFQFDLRSLFLWMTMSAVTLALIVGWLRNPMDSPLEFGLLTLAVSVLVGLAVGRLPGREPDTATFHLPTRPGTWLLWAGVIGGGLRLAKWFDMKTGYVGLGWLITYALFASQCIPAIRLRMLAFLAAMYLPFLWMFPYGWNHRLSGFLGMFPVAPGMLPSILIISDRDYELIVGTLVVVAATTLGYVAARHSRVAIGWLSGVVCFGSIFGSFMIHALMRA